MAFSKNSIKFTSEDEKAFYTVQDTSLQDQNCLGYCFKIVYKNKVADQAFWVSTPGIFGESSKYNLFARCCKEDNVEHKLKSEVHSKDGVSFIKSNCKDNSNSLEFGYTKCLPQMTSAYVFDGKKPLALEFHKTSDSTNDYKLVSSKSSKASRNFDLSKAVGAPVIIPNYEPARNQVVGILDAKQDGSLYPVFFNLDTFDLDKTPTESPSNEVKEIIKAGAVTQNQPSEDTTDSPIVVSAGAVTQNQPEETSEDTTDSQITVSEATTQNQPGEASGNTTNSQIVSSGHIHQHGQGTNSTTASSNLTPIFQDRCIKNKTISQAPHKLFMDLEILLEPQRPLGGDYRTLSDKFGHSNADLNYFETKDSRTKAILRQHMYECTFQTLRNYLTNMERADAVDVIDKFIRENCECEQCGNLR